jgi:hypothetical protein
MPVVGVHCELLAEAKPATGHGTAVGTDDELDGSVIDRAAAVVQSA